MHIDENKIINDCQKGDLEKFSVLYDVYVDKIYRFIFYKTSHRETAEDLTSQTFIKSMKAINSFDDKKGTFQAWLFRIARNTVIDFYRTKKNLMNIDDVWELGTTQRMEATLEVGHTIHSEQLLFRTRLCPENVLSTQDDLRKAQEYLANLSPRQREIVFLRVWDNMPYKQIAEIINETEANCKMIFSRTIKKMKSDLGPLAALLLLVITNQ